MRLRTLILILVAAGCGLVAAVLVSQYVGGGNQATAASAPEKVKVLYAKVTVPGRIPIDKPEDFFEIREVSRDEVRDGIGEFEKVKGRVLKIPLGRGKPLAEMDLYGPNEQVGITDRLKKGERPMTVKVTPLTNTAGFVRPGDRVDIVATARARGNEGATARTILQDVEVLAIDQSLQSQTTEVAKQADYVTLRVTQDQVEQLAAYSETCTLRLVPRRADDSELFNSKGYTAGERLDRKIPQTQREKEQAEEDPDAKPAVAAKPEVKPEPSKPRGPSGPGDHTLIVDIGGNRVEQKYKIKDKKDEEGNK